MGRLPLFAVAVVLASASEATAQPAPATPSANAYYQFLVGRRHESAGDTDKARYAYKLFIGEIPPGHFVCHVCDVRCCVNPAHLFLGSHTDNMRDRSNKGRYNAEFNGRSKLSRIDIQRIREMSSEGVSYKQLAMSLGVSKSAIYCVVKGLTWKHIPKAN